MERLPTKTILAALLALALAPTFTARAEDNPLPAEATKAIIGGPLRSRAQLQLQDSIELRGPGEGVHNRFLHRTAGASDGGAGDVHPGPDGQIRATLNDVVHACERGESQPQIVDQPFHIGNAKSARRLKDQGGNAR